MMLREAQASAVDAIKRHALALAARSPRAEARLLNEYLWIEEGSELAALEASMSDQPPPWLVKLGALHLADERRHAALLRERLAELGVRARPAPRYAAWKLRWIQRAAARYDRAFSAGPIVVVLAVAAQLEATGVRMFARHVAVLDERAPESRAAEVLRSILADERRHAKSCAAAAERLVRADERERFDTLRARIAHVDRAFGVTHAVLTWLAVAATRAREGRLRT